MKHDLTFHNEDNLHEMSNPVPGKNKKNITDMLSVEFAHRVVNSADDKVIFSHSALKTGSLNK